MGYIPPHFQARIKEAQEQGLRELDLSNDRRTNHAVKLTEIPAEVFQLEQLESLNLSNNRIRKIPQQLRRLPNLQSLDLWGNRLVEFPHVLGNLSNLARLRLSLGSLELFPEWLARIKELSLDLRSNKLTEIPESLTKLSNLTQLDLRVNQLTEIPESLTKLSNLTELHLSGNQLTEIPESLTKLSNLTELYLSGNQLTEIPESLTKLSNLTQLDLSGNQLTEIPESLTKLSNLTQLGLSGNQLTEIPESLTKLSNLTQLGLSGNQLTEIPESLTKLSNLTLLYLSGNQLTEIPESLTKLSNLTELHLSGNQLTEIPESLTKLSNLTQLDLRVNQLTEIPESLTKLSNLTELHLSGNQLTEIPESLTKLSNLTELHLSGNQLTEIPESLTKLSNLTELDLRVNQLTEIPESLTKLSNLTELHLSGNQLTEIPESLTKLSNLTQLHLSGNQLTEIPESLTKLSNLTQLHLSGNQLTEIPESLTKLSNLTELHLSGNQLTEIPESLTKLSNLTLLGLSGNQLTEIPESLTKLSNLTELDLSGNQLTEIPESLTKLSNLTLLLLDENPLKYPPLEIANRGMEAIKQYFQQFQQGKDYLYEAKLLIVGEAGAGKTTLAKKIDNPNYLLQEEDSTEGIEVITYNFNYTLPNQPQQQNFRTNIWDFGGQEIYHATHQFFLTKRSLYVVVVDNRKEDDNLDYWLNIVELLSDNSPVLIIKNEKQDRTREINELYFRGQFSNLKEIFPTNLKDNRGLPEILTQIQHYLSTLPHVGEVLPKTWTQVREVLEKLPKDYISLEEYFRICQENSITEREYKLQLSGYLHDLGVCLHFQDDPLLKKAVILKPEWGTAAVYKVLDNDKVRQNFGEFTKEDLAEIWQEKQYEDSQDELLQLMIKFKLCYQIPNQEIYIAPQLLTQNQPRYDWDDTNNLLLRYTYDFMPKGILTQFIVVMHRYIQQQEYVWKTGVILQKEETIAEVMEYYSQREIKIRVAGKHQRDFLTILIEELDKIHGSYQRLKYNKLIPCNCPRCKDNPEPYFYQYDELLERIGNQKQTIECRKSPYHEANVLSLIDHTLDLRRWEKSLQAERRGTDRESILEILKAFPNLSINNFNHNHNKGDNHVSRERKINISARTINASGTAFNQGNITDTVANTIHQLPDSNSKEREIKELLSKLEEAINSTPELGEEDKTEALEQVATLEEAGANPNEGKWKKAAKTATLALKGLAASLPQATKFIEACDKILPHLTQLIS